MTEKTPFLALACARAVPAFGASDGDRVMQRVSHADPDLASPAAVAALDRRIEQAVRAVCGNANDGAFATRVRALRCRQSARESASLQREQLLARRAPAISLASSR